MQYITMYSDIGHRSNTMIFNDRPADVNALLAQAAAVMQGVSLGAGAGVGTGTGASMGSLPSRSSSNNSNSDSNSNHGAAAGETVEEGR